MPPKRKRQARLTFEPTGAQNPTESQFSPANVRYASSSRLASSQVTSSPSRAAKTKGQAVVASAKKKKKKSQTTIQDTMSGAGKSSNQSSQGNRPPSKAQGKASFMPQSQMKRATVLSSSEEDNDDDSDDEDNRYRVSYNSQTAGPAGMKSSWMADDDSDDEEESGQAQDLAPAEKAASDVDDDDEPIQPSSSRTRRAPARVSESSSESDLPTKKRKKIIQLSSSSPSPSPAATPARRLTRRGQPSSSPTKAHKGHRTPKQKHMELLKRRRAGEKIDQLTSSESDSEDDKRGLYDTASDDELQVLEEFPDDEEDEVSEDAESKKKAAKSPRKPRRNSLVREEVPSGSDEGSDLNGFVTEDDDAPIGAPANLGLPYEFTAQARKPLKDQFPHVIEWLVHNKINPSFDRKDGAYVHAWRKLDDEVRGLANSKFISSVWKVHFYRTLKARPKMEAYEVGVLANEMVSCEACGRGGHPATWRIQFQGQPYHKETLDEVESDSDDSDGASVDTQGNELPATTKQWMVGSVCCSNAETAHSLMHWKHALKEWVEDRLETDGHMKPAKLKEREKMKSKKRRKAADEIVDGWKANGTVNALYADFKSVLQQARDKSTSGRGGARWK